MKSCASAKDSGLYSYLVPWSIRECVWWTRRKKSDVFNHTFEARTRHGVFLKFSRATWLRRPLIGSFLRLVWLVLGFAAFFFAVRRTADSWFHPWHFTWDLATIPIWTPEQTWKVESWTLLTPRFFTVSYHPPGAKKKPKRYKRRI